jgi:hypothetical protein
MVRKAVLALAMLAVATGPAQAFQPQYRPAEIRPPDARYWHQRGPRTPVPPPGTAVYTPQCVWQPAYWFNHVIPNEWGGYAYAPQFVPGRWVCQ